MRDINVFDEEYWVSAWTFPNYKVSSWGRVMDEHGDEVPLTYSRGELRCHLKYGPNEFVGALWQLVYMTFFRDGWGVGIRVEYRDGNPRNCSMFNLLFWDGDVPLMYRLNEHTGLWERKRRNARRVEIVETGQQFESVVDLATAIDGDRNAIYMCLRGVQQSHKGFSFRYLD